jgi:hypothetical protein
VALSHVSPLSHVLPCFPILVLSSLHLVILNTHISLIRSPILEIFSAMNLALHFLHIYHLDFYLKKKKSCLQTLRRFYGITSFPRYPFVEIIFYENQDGTCFL